MQMNELQPTLGRLISVWWLLTWRSGVGAVLLGAVAGFIIGFVGAMAGVSSQSTQVMATLAGAALGLMWAIYVLRTAFNKRFGDFRIALVPVNA